MNEQTNNKPITIKSDKASKKSNSTKRPVGINESVLRLSFLEQAAALVTSSSTSRTDAYNALSKLYVKEIRQICNVEQLRMHREFKRSVCKKCHRIWSIPDRTCEPSFFVKKSRMKRALWRVCGDCQRATRFIADPNYLSRNERAELEQKGKRETMEIKGKQSNNR